MLCLLCCIILLYITPIQPVSVQIDGSIDLGQNFKFDLSPLLNLGRMANINSSDTTLPPDVSAIIEDITATTSNDEKQRSEESRKSSEAQKTTKKLKKKKHSSNTPEDDIGDHMTLTRKEKHDKSGTEEVNTEHYEHNSKQSDEEEVPHTAIIPDFRGKIKKSHKKIKHKQNEEDTSSSSEPKHRKKSKNTVTTEDISVVTAGQQLGNVLAKFGYNEPQSTTNTKRNKIPDILRMQYDDEPGRVTMSDDEPDRVTMSDDEPDRVTMFDHEPPPTNNNSDNNESDDENKKHKRAKLYDEPHFISHDTKIQDFTLDVFKQGLTVFDAIKSKVNDTKVKTKVDFVARSYRNKFADFVNETQHQKIVTRLGTQKVVLNVIDTSNRIMTRLLNFLIGDMEKKGVLRDNEGIAHIWRSQVENEEQQEYVQVCQQFNICRSKYSFSSFVADYFTVLLQVDDKKLKLSIDALTEVLKETDLSKIMNDNMQSRFGSNIAMMERAEPNVLRPMLWMFRNMLINKNQPLVVQEKVPKRVINQTVALLDVIDILDEKITATETNLLEWNDLRNSLVQWANGQRTDILDIMQAFVNMIVTQGVDKMSTRMSSSFHHKLKMFLKFS